MSKKTNAKKRVRRKSFVKVLRNICEWLVIIGLVLFSLFYLAPWTDDNVTKVQGVVSNISTYAPLGGMDTYVTFSLDEKDYYYYITDGLYRKDVQALLQKTADADTEITIFATEKVQLSRFLTFSEKERVVGIEGEGVDLPVSLLNRDQKVRQITALSCAFLLIFLKYSPQIVYFFVVRSVDKGKCDRKNAAHRGAKKK